MSPKRDRDRGDRSDRGKGNKREHNNGNSNTNNYDIWTEHVSSSGKKYYYNSLCGISQWDKPPDWVDTNTRNTNTARSHQDHADHPHKRFREAASSYQHQHQEYRRPHYSALQQHDVQVLHDTDTSSGGSTPVQEAGRIKPQEQPAPSPLPVSVPMVNALPRNLSHQCPQTAPAVSSNPCAALAKPKSEAGGGGYESPMLTPSLSKYVLNDLCKHVNGWPAEVLERQAQKFSEESYQLGNLQCMKVCTELKCARAVVRQLEIQATLQDQKMMYLRQQIESVKDVKSHNSVLSGD